MPKPIGDTNIGKYGIIPTEWCVYGENNAADDGKLRPLAIPFLIALGIGVIALIQPVMIFIYNHTADEKYRNLTFIYFYYDETWIPKKLGLYQAPPPDPNYVFKGAPTWPEE